jgi:hypothetical protein
MTCKICYTKDGYNNIIKAWIDGKNHSDIYHMISKWIDHTKNQEEYNNKKDIVDMIDDINYRMYNNDETHDIVEDFIYGSRYNKLRSKFL